MRHWTMSEKNDLKQLVGIGGSHQEDMISS